MSQAPNTRFSVTLWFVILIGAALPVTGAAQQSLESSYPAMIERIIEAMQPDSGELVIIRYDPTGLPRFSSYLRRALDDRGVDADLMQYGTITGFIGRLEEANIYIQLPIGRSGQQASPDQVKALNEWLDSGQGRQVHFHWAQGTIGTDWTRGDHTPAYDRVYVDALDIDYAQLDRKQNAAIAVLRSGEVRVTTPAGTDLMFRLGDRPVNKQNGDASKERMTSARVRIDREIELPAGAIRVAPIEGSVRGTLVIPSATVRETEVRNLTFEFTDGRITNVSALQGEEDIRALLQAVPELTRLREFVLGLNPMLVTPSGNQWLPYYGYGAGIVRLSLGENSELGGAVTGGEIQRFLFPDATVTVGELLLVDEGALIIPPLRSR